MRLNELLKLEGALHAPEVSRTVGDRIIGPRYIQRWARGLVEFIGNGDGLVDGEYDFGDCVAVVFMADND